MALPPGGPRPQILDNSTCPYCGGDLSGGAFTQDHVVGRKFVPKGSLHGSWSLIVNCCESCNRGKGNLEDSISAQSMHLWTTDSEADRALRAEAIRKARGSVGIRADRQRQNLKLQGQVMPGLKMSFDVVGPPPSRPDEIAQLASLHGAAFFYFVTYDKESKHGRFWRGDYRMVNWAGRTDWGNARKLAFMDLIRDWEPVLLIDTANGFFKAAMRRDTATGEFFSWAVEWNTNFRVTGFIGEVDILERRLRDFPSLTEMTVGESPEGTVRARLNHPLNSEQDDLFTFEI